MEKHHPPPFLQFRRLQQRFHVFAADLPDGFSLPDRGKQPRTAAAHHDQIKMSEILAVQFHPMHLLPP